LLAELRRKMLFFVVKTMEGKDMNNDERQRLRKKILGARDLLSASERQEKSRSAMQNLMSLPKMKHWSTLFIYVHFRSELETLELIHSCLSQGKRVAVPLVDAATVMCPVIMISLSLTRRNLFGLRPVKLTQLLFPAVFLISMGDVSVMAEDIMTGF
jgi:5,10-methenyltetrahydrofolate synthetase